MRSASVVLRRTSWIIDAAQHLPLTTPLRAQEERLRLEVERQKGKG